MKLIAPRGFEPLTGKQQANTNKGLRKSQESVLATGLDKTLQKYPDLQQVITAWPELPEHVGKTIKELIQKYKAEQK